ncbi:MAG TPA: hypothetical protein DD490_05920, partial [Acidobacteria bacterium]|nr:hypothetical protein [Acidobacteriota bacterium]
MTAPALSSALHLRPRCRLGAASPGGLALPDAHPSAATLYAPRGVFLDLDPAAAEPSGRIVVVDSGSSDGTAEIARGLGAQVTVTPDWPGFGVQKGRALAL